MNRRELFAGAGAAALSAAGTQAAAPRDALDALVEDAAADWQPVLAPLVEPLLAQLDAAIAGGQTLQDFRAQLPGLFGRMDAAALAERVARAGFMAGLAGAADLDVDNINAGI